MTSTKTVGVVGLGRLGRGITVALIRAGFHVVGCDANPKAAERAVQAVADGLADMEAHGCAKAAHYWRERLQITQALDALAPCNFVLESITESTAEKRSLFAVIEEIVAPDAVIASNTSAIPIGELQKGRTHPERFVGMHWAEPAYITRFLEVIRGEQTAEWAVDAALALGRAAGKQPCVVNRDVAGFIANRLGYALYREALHLLETGIGDVETIDRAFRNSIGLWATLCGPFQWIDISGGPALYAAAMAPVLPTLSNSVEVPARLQQMAVQDTDGTAERGFYGCGADEMEIWEQRLQSHAWAVWRLMEKYDPLGPGDAA